MDPSLGRSSLLLCPYTRRRNNSTKKKGRIGHKQKKHVGSSLSLVFSIKEGLGGVGGGGAVCYLCVCVLCTELKDPFGNHADTSTYVKRRSDCTLMLRVLFSLFTFSFFFFPGRRIITERKKRWKKIFSSFFCKSTRR